MLIILSQKLVFVSIISIVAAFAITPILASQSASAATNNCRDNVVGACVATDDVLRNAKVNAQVCANVLAQNNPGCDNEQ